MIQFSYGKDAISKAAEKVIEIAGSEKVWVFKGEMGAGKTTFIKALAEQFHIPDQISSPTFGIVNEYQNDRGEEFYHFDFYRLDDPTEALDIGIEEYFYSQNYCWLEWAEKVADFLPDQYFLIKLEILSDSERKLTLQHVNDVS
ncbi:tRNA (adenosine(37)-N6)-threonylcarbamoyltransferase complex ATPase subunit type 1 TsaE [Algoriphagus lutimaris]|uniref:tRNA (adenosine(37)-N6)-threonylcarbamoyltransferase complex ATPase subunit type 1 TsaE n=1 Tax=Algoriphagus lutimaris TaxID=613197 RepID=UPI00196B84D9|nr:tRNA (adenosine(37)-N6)-threonylcarbamoyltransferase complex ATPase subunit type 1 TsaE [Algoriphagus lutimaris]MBN3518390.1 tRNA (adenosine(37)-N6)-threonylcarbamoyltransferase complex ATPase subunit type 1 TsaE [Algoriphagus lutimaris]